jgi:hypothetical protein
MDTILRRQRAIEREFEEPLRDVVAGFVEMGYSHRLVAEALEVTAPSLRRYMRTQGVPMARQPLVRAGTGRPAQTIRYGGRERTARAWATDLGVCPATVWWRVRTKGRPEL